MTKDFFIKQLSQILEDFKHLASKAKYHDLSDINSQNAEDITVLLTKSKAAIERIVGSSSEYYKDVLRTLDRKDKHDGSKLRLVIGTISALKSDLENDYLKKLHDIVQSEVFSNYLEMAQYLLIEGFKDPSAVLIGSTLEVQLRDLCKANLIDTEILNNKEKLVAKKADVMNSDLSKKGIYSSAYQKQITAWLDIRNSAAHGKYQDYSIEEIKLMLQGVRQFLLKTN